ncbi:MAG: hydrogenase maturation protease [Thiobacillus sp.]
MSSEAKPVRILGIGSPSGDDQAGWLTVDALRAAGMLTSPAIVIDKLDRPGANLIPMLENASRVILVDAMQRGGEPGEIRHFDQQDWPDYGHGLSSHGFGVLAALSLARELGSLSPRLDLYGIEIGSVNPDEKPDDCIRAAARQLARRIAAELGYTAV